jgi:kynurenine formamidase
MRFWVRNFIGIVGFCALLSVGQAAQTANLNEALAILKAHRFIDLTHSFGPGIPHFSQAPDESVKTLYTVAKDGFYMQEFCHIGQWGTHVDPPAHFHEGLHSVDQIDPTEMVMPLVVIDVHDKVEKNADYVLSLDDVNAWERRHGKIPKGAFVAMRTDWAKRWPDSDKMANRDAAGVGHYPGWSLPVLKLLYEERGITASGHETTDTDPGVRASQGDYSLESYILGKNHYQIEMLSNLDQTPEAGAIVIVSFPKPEHGSGFPARVIAIVP